MTETEIIERALFELERAANFLRGVLFDPAIPDLQKRALENQLKELETVAATLADEFTEV